MADYNITAVTRRVVYTGSAGVGPYAFTFPVISQTDIAVYKNSTKLTLTTNYTVTVSSANGTGSVTLVVAATGADRIVIIGARAIERTTDFVTAGDLKASSLNEQLDASIILIQQLAEENKRTLKAPQFDPAAVEDGGTLSMVLPVSTSRAGKTLAFDTDGNPVVGEDIGNWRGNWAAGVSFTVRDLVKTSDDSNVYRVNTAHTSSGALPLSTNADYAKFDLVVDAAAAAASAAAAAASASAAATSASNASTSASGASTSASNASTSASAAASSASTASTAASAALAAYDSFDDRYLGVFTTDPTLDNDGNALVAGALYFNSVSGVMRLYTGSAWVAAYVQGVASDIGFTPTGNIAAINVQTAIAEVDSEKIASTAIGVTVQGYDVDTAKTDVVQTFTVSQRGTVTTDNDLSFNLSTTNNFFCTPTGTGTLTFTNHVAGQSGFVLLVNSSGYAITAAATTKINSTDLSTISTAGTYLLSYFDNGTNAYVVISRNVA